MDEMKLIEDFCAEEAQPGPERLARSRARLMTAIEGGQHSASVPLGRPRTTRMVSLALSATAVGTAGALAIVSLAAGGKPVTPGDSHVPAGLLAGQPARPFLLAMAVKAAQQKTGRFYCTTEVQGDRELVGAGDRLLPQPWADRPGPRPHLSAPGIQVRADPQVRDYAVHQSLGCHPVDDLHAVPGGPPRVPGRRPCLAPRRLPGPLAAGAWRPLRSPGSRGGSSRRQTRHRGLWREKRSVAACQPCETADGLLGPPAARGQRTEQCDRRGGTHGHERRLRTARGTRSGLPGPRKRAGRADATGSNGPRRPNRHRRLARLLDRRLSPVRNHLRHHRPADRQHARLGETVAQTPVAGAAPGTVLFYSATTSARWTSQLPPPTP